MSRQVSQGSAEYPIAGAHHDGSPSYVSHGYPDPGAPVTVRVRIGERLRATAVSVRSTYDGSQRFDSCERESPEWWRVTLTMRNRRLSYRFLITTPTGALTLNGAGLWSREVPDTHDFRITTDPPPPSWAAGSVFYEIFLDRFARESLTPIDEGALPDWAVPSSWDDPVRHSTPQGVLQLYGGDIPGVTAHLDHLERLGATAIYLTPFFPAISNHRYDASSFARVDPILGGDAALADLVREAHGRGIRVIGDLTLNHTGSEHEWFLAAQHDPGAPEAAAYVSAGDGSFESFDGVPTLPRLDHRDDLLRSRLLSGEASVVHRHLESGLDGWRIDVAQSAGHIAASDRTLESARELMATARHARADAYVVAEHQYDASEALAGDAWHGTMAYASFTRPVWSWLAETDIDRYWAVPGAHTPYTGATMAEVMDDFAGLIPWRSRIHSLNLLDSHDTPRFLTVAGEDRYRVGLGLLLTMPGIPMLFAGDEIGTQGINPEDGRRPFRWDPDTWNMAVYEATRDLVRLRARHDALTHGSFRWLHTGEDVVLFERCSATESLVVKASRRDHRPLIAEADLAGIHGCGDIVAGAAFPSGGPAFQVWAVAGSSRSSGGRDHRDASRSPGPFEQTASSRDRSKSWSAERS